MDQTPRIHVRRDRRSLLFILLFDFNEESSCRGTNLADAVDLASKIGEGNVGNDDDDGSKLNDSKNNGTCINDINDEPLRLWFREKGRILPILVYRSSMRKWE